MSDPDAGSSLCYRPSACAIMLTADRPEMTRQAVEAFRSQSYDNKRLLIWDTGKVEYIYSAEQWDAVIQPSVNRSAFVGSTIGNLRNYANKYAAHHYRTNPPDIFVHWDDDDLSMSDRISCQVELLQSSGADCVGFNEVVFWRTRTMEEHVGRIYYGRCSEAWLYTDTRPHMAIGSSLCYRREFWERHKFADGPKNSRSTSEYYQFLKYAKCVGASSIVDGKPLMVCRIHGGNTTDYSNVGSSRAKSASWRRAPEWDDFCREMMK